MRASGGPIGLPRRFSVCPIVKIVIEEARGGMEDPDHPCLPFLRKGKFIEFPKGLDSHFHGDDEGSDLGKVQDP
jgi:hypothetical protein